jgi:hypothetical protein
MFDSNVDKGKLQIPSIDILRQMVIDEFKYVGLTYENGEIRPNSEDKNFQRTMHITACAGEINCSKSWILSKWARFSRYFANGSDINPHNVKPRLVEVKTQFQHDLFRLARYTWSLPYTKGFGRRLQFLVMDDANEKLIGVLGLQSPPLSFPARDRLYHYPKGEKVELVNQTLDVYTLGAVQPYARLLGGKLIALIAASNEVRETYQKKYNGRKTEMEDRILPAHLVCLTTTSAFGRSSIYNRLVYNQNLIAEPIGYTEGYGAFHLQKLYPYFRAFLEKEGISIRGKYGGYDTGPRVKWQIMVLALHKLGFSSELLKHGVKREVFLFPFASNLKEYMEGLDSEPNYLNRPFCELSEFWQTRWLLPRSDRVDGWHAWDKENIIEGILTQSRLFDDHQNNITTSEQIDLINDPIILEKAR